MIHTKNAPMPNQKRTIKYIAMLGPSLEAMGGMASVAATYRAAGLFDTWPVLYVETYRDDGTSKIAVFLKALGRMIRLMAGGHIQCIHLHVATRTSFLRKSIFMLLAILFRVPYVFHIHGADFDEFAEELSGPLTREYVRFLLVRSSAVIALSQHWSLWVSRFAPGSKVVAIPNPVELPRHTLPPQHDRPDHVLFLGQLGQRKGVLDLVAALAQIAAHFPQAHLYCGGDGNQDLVLQRAKALGIQNRVTMLGWVRGTAKSKLLSEAAVFALPSYHEGLPVAILEAMANGATVISTRVGGIPDAIDSGVDGLLIEAGDVNGLADALRSLLGNPSLRHDLATNARAKVEDLYAAPRILAQLGSVYRQLGCMPAGVPPGSSLN